MDFDGSFAQRERIGYAVKDAERLVRGACGLLRAAQSGDAAGESGATRESAASSAHHSHPILALHHRYS